MVIARVFMSMFAALALGGSVSAFAANIHETVRSGDVQATAQMLSSNRSLISAKNELGSTPLHIAASNSTPEIARLLIEKGAAVNARDNHGVTPLHIAAFTGHKENVEFLLKQGADVHAKDGMGKTARDYAETSLSREISAILLIKMLATPAPVARK